MPTCRPGCPCNLPRGLGMKPPGRCVPRSVSWAWTSAGGTRSALRAVTRARDTRSRGPGMPSWARGRGRGGDPQEEAGDAGGSAPWAARIPGNVVHGLRGEARPGRVPGRAEGAGSPRGRARALLRGAWRAPGKLSHEPEPATNNPTDPPRRKERPSSLALGTMTQTPTFDKLKVSAGRAGGLLPVGRVLKGLNPPREGGPGPLLVLSGLCKGSVLTPGS